MKLVFLDANILFSVAYREKAGLVRLWRLHGVKLVTSDYVAQEVAANLIAPAQRDRLAKLLKSVAIISHPCVLPALPVGVSLPEKDTPILQAAMSARAAVLLTGDVTHFRRYFGKVVGGVRILPPADFLQEAGK